VPEGNIYKPSKGCPQKAQKDPPNSTPPRAQCREYPTRENPKLERPKEVSHPRERDIKKNPRKPQKKSLTRKDRVKAPSWKTQNNLKAQKEVKFKPTGKRD